MCRGSICHRRRGLPGPITIKTTCSRCGITRALFKEDGFAFNRQWDSHYCQDCNIWVQNEACDEYDCDERCPFYGRPDYPNLL